MITHSYVLKKIIGKTNPPFRNFFVTYIITQKTYESILIYMYTEKF